VSRKSVQNLKTRFAAFTIS